MNLSIEWNDFPLVEMVFITTAQKYTYRFPAGYNISINLANMTYIYSISDQVYSNSPSTSIDVLNYRGSQDPFIAMPQPNERVTLDLTVQFPDPADFVYEPIEPMEPFEPLFTSAGFAYFGTLVVLPNNTTTVATEATVLRLPINRSTGVDLNAQIDESGMYISPIDDSALQTTVISEQAEINFIKEQVMLRILNPTDIVHYYESTQTYVVSNIFQFEAPVQYVTPYTTAMFYENMQNVLLPIPLTGGEFDVNFITKTVTQRSTRLYTEPFLNTSIAIITYSDGSVVPMLAENTSVYGNIPERGLFLVVGYDSFTPMEDVGLDNLQDDVANVQLETQIIIDEPLPDDVVYTPPSYTPPPSYIPPLNYTPPNYTLPTPDVSDATTFNTPEPKITYIPETMNRGDPLRTPLPTERTTVVDNSLTDVLKPADVVNEPPPVDDVNKPPPVDDDVNDSNDKPTWFYPVVIVVPLVVVIIAVIVGVVIYRKRSARAKKI